MLWIWNEHVLCALANASVEVKSRSVLRKKREFEWEWVWKMGKLRGNIQPQDVKTMDENRSAIVFASVFVGTLSVLLMLHMQQSHAKLFSISVKSEAHSQHFYSICFTIWRSVCSPFANLQIRIQFLLMVIQNTLLGLNRDGLLAYRKIGTSCTCYIATHTTIWLQVPHKSLCHCREKNIAKEWAIERNERKF